MKLSGGGNETLSDLWERFLRPSCIAYRVWVQRVSELLELEPPLIVAPYYQLGPVFRYLLDAGANPNCCDANRRTPLHFAVAHGDEDSMRLLLGKAAEMGSRRCHVLLNSDMTK